MVPFVSIMKGALCCYPPTIMKRNNYTKYFRVFKNDTVVTEISANNFESVVIRRFKRGLPVNTPVDSVNAITCFEYSLPADDTMFYGYLTQGHAMRKAKDSALNYINLLSKEAGPGQQKLKQYREDHYNDLNVTLLDANIRRVENEINIK